MRKVTINGYELDASTVAALERQMGHIAAGDYWYDRECGAWGVIGGPCVGFVASHVLVGGELAPEASGGMTQVFINGRAAHPMDLLRLPLAPGRYTIDDRLRLFAEGGAMLADLGAAMQAQAAQQAQGGPWSYTSGMTGASVGGDGQGFSYFIDGDVSWTGG